MGRKSGGAIGNLQIKSKWPTFRPCSDGSRVPDCFLSFLAWLHLKSVLEDREKCGCNVTIVAQPPAKRVSVCSHLSVMLVPGC